MSTPNAGQRGNAWRLLRRMFVGRPPSKPPGRVNLALTLLGFPVWFCMMILTWGAIPPLMTLAVIGMALSGVMATLGSLASYHRWRGDRSGELLRVASHLPGMVGLALLLAYFVRNGQWEWVWWSVFVLALTTIVFVVGDFYGPGDGADPEDARPEGRDPSN